MYYFWTPLKQGSLNFPDARFCFPGKSQIRDDLGSSSLSTLLQYTLQIILVWLIFKALLSGDEINSQRIASVKYSLRKHIQCLYV